MNTGKCVFENCKMPSGTCLCEDGDILLLCQQHYEHMSNLQTKELIDKVFRSTKKEEGSNV